MSNEPRLRIEPFALALVGLLFTEHLLFGADRIDFSLLFGVLQLGLLLALILVSRGAEPPRLPLTAPAILFSLAFAIGLLSVLPVGLPLAHPLWAYVQRIEPGVAATISMDPAATRMQLVKLAGLGALFLVGASLGGRREAAERTGRYVTLAGLLYCLWAGGAFVVDPNTTFGFHRFYGMGRLSASFSSPNIAATLFASLTIWALAGLMRPLLRVRRSGEPITAAEIGLVCAP